jgi:hypothetical protein
MYRVIAVLCLAPITVFAAPGAFAQFGIGNPIIRPGVIVDTFPDRKKIAGASRMIAPEILAGRRGLERARLVSMVRSVVARNVDTDTVEWWRSKSGQLTISIKASRQRPAAELRADPAISDAAKRDVEARRAVKTHASGLVLDELPPDTPCRRIELTPESAAEAYGVGSSLPSSLAIACNSSQGYWDAALLVVTPAPASGR